MSETEQAVAKSKREIIADCIDAGGATMESLILAANCKYESVMSNFSMLRLMGKCPVKDVEVDGVLTYRFVTSEEWESMKAEKAANAGAKRTSVTKSPAERLIAADKRTDRCEKALVSAAERAKSAPNDELLALRQQKADIELKIAVIEHSTAKEAVDNDESAQAEYEKLTTPESKDPDTPESEPFDAEADEDSDDIDFE